jgi:hypothetical protein
MLKQNVAQVLVRPNALETFLHFVQHADIHI